MALSATLSVATASIHAQDAIPAPLAHISENFAAAVTAKDAAKVASFYTDDAVLLPPNSQMIKGRAAIQNFFQGMMQQNPTLKLTPVAASIAGSQAYEMGTSLVTMRPAAPSAPAASAAGPGMTSPGKYIVVYKKVGNDWKIAYDIFNDNQPAAPPPPGARGR